MLATIPLNAGVMYLTYRIGVGVAERRHLIVGSVAAVLLQVLQTFGVVYVGRVVRDASASNGWSASSSACCLHLSRGRHPHRLCRDQYGVREAPLSRALLTPFTDNVSSPTPTKKQYAAQARMMPDQTV